MVISAARGPADCRCLEPEETRLRKAAPRRLMLAFPASVMASPGGQDRASRGRRGLLLLPVLYISQHRRAGDPWPATTLTPRAGGRWPCRPAKGGLDARPCHPPAGGSAKGLTGLRHGRIRHVPAPRDAAEECARVRRLLFGIVNRKGCAGGGVSKRRVRSQAHRNTRCA